MRFSLCFLHTYVESIDTINDVLLLADDVMGRWCRKIRHDNEILILLNLPSLNNCFRITLDHTEARFHLSVVLVYATILSAVIILSRELVFDHAVVTKRVGVASLRVYAQVKIILNFVIDVVLPLKGFNLLLNALDFLHRFLDVILFVLNLDKAVYFLF